MRGVLALLVRFLRQDTRGLASHLLRGGIALMVLIILGSVLDRRVMLGAPGRVVFIAIGWVNYLFISIAAIGFFSTSITEEKEEQTLGLLRMAGISPLSLLLGKSASRLWLALVLIAVQLPFTLLSVTLGGVTLRQVFATYVALAAYTFLLSGVATVCSVFSSRSTRAVAWMFLASVLLWFLPIIAVGVDDAAAGVRSPNVAAILRKLAYWMNQLSVSTRLQSVTMITFEDPVFEHHFLASIVAGCMAYLISWLCFDWCANRHVDESPSRGAILLARTRAVGAGRAWESAVSWKDFSFMAGGRLGWLCRLAIVPFCVGAFCALFAWSGTQVDAQDVGESTMFVCTLLCGLELAVQSTRFLAEEKANRTLALMRMFPRSLPRTLYAKMAGLLLGVIPYCFCFFVGMLLAPDTVGDAVEDLTRDVENLFGCTYLFSLGVVYLHLNVLLSTYIKWGAIPVSFGILVAFNICCVVAMRPSNSMTVAALFFTLTACAVVATGILQALILDRCRLLAGE